ncbi:MAG: hypothetical protein PVF27_03865 [Gemmatimonadales bacterium]|jgi:hypothetical protein
MTASACGTDQATITGVEVPATTEVVAASVATTLWIQGSACEYRPGRYTYRARADHPESVVRYEWYVAYGNAPATAIGSDVSMSIWIEGGGTVTDITLRALTVTGDWLAAAMSVRIVSPPAAGMSLAPIDCGGTSR